MSATAPAGLGEPGQDRILVVGPSWVGDMVMAQSLFKTLRRQRPESVIDVLAPPWSRPLLSRMPEVAAAIDLPVDHGRLGLGIRRRVARGLSDCGYVQAIVLPNSLKSALVPFWARVPRRTGWLGEMRFGLLNDLRRLPPGDALPMTVQRFVALAAPAAHGQPPEIEPPRLRVAAAAAERARAALGIAPPQGPVLALCPGAEFGPAKRWPAAAYGTLARRRLEAGWAVWLFGADNDRASCAAVQHAAGGGCLDLCARTSLEQAVDLLSEVDAVVTNDSGLMHVAAALERPLVAVFGSSDPQATPPLSARASVLSLNLECSPCLRRSCPKKHTQCLNDLSPERVDARLTQHLRGEPLNGKE